MTDILDTIDAALADMSLSPDAMRWSPDGAPLPDYYTRADIYDWETDHRLDVIEGQRRGFRS